MPLQATGQSEKLIVQPRWCAIVAQQPPIRHPEIQVGQIVQKAAPVAVGFDANPLVSVVEGAVDHGEI